jgi:hypothetical protein
MEIYALVTVGANMSNKAWNSMIQRLAFWGMGSFTAVLLIGPTVFSQNLCDGPDCLREWISALSGYFAAMGALIAAGLTLPPLLKQASEAKRQTDFALGDADPTFRVTRLAGATVEVRCVNWNRRDYQINSIGLADENGAFEVRLYEYAVNDGKMMHDHGLGYYGSKIIHGWEDRSSRPDTLTVRIDIHPRIGVYGESLLPKVIFIAGILADTENMPLSHTFHLPTH